MGRNGEALTNGNHGNREAPEEEEDDVIVEDDDIYCGVGACRPTFMQKCASIGCLTPALSFAGLTTSTLSIYISSQITTLERQFGFSSSMSGVLLSCNDLGYLMTTLTMSFLARRVHIPRALSLSTLLFGLAGLVCTVPFFATRATLPPISSLTSANASSDGVGGALGSLCLLLDAQSSTLNSHHSALNASYTSGSGSGLGEAAMTMLRNSSSSSSAGSNSCGSEGGDERASSAISADGRVMAITLIAIGMIFQGFGKSPRPPLIGTYIDDNVPKTKTTFYLGIISGMAIFGPVLAFTLGGLFSRIYITLEDTDMSPMDPRWVGAWWLGFLLFGFMGVLAAIPTLFFPRRLRPQPHLRKLEEDRKRKGSHRMCTQDSKEFLKTLFRLLFKSPVYLCVVAGMCCSLFGVGGMISFLPKYLETQFRIPTWKANILLGVLNVMAAAAGTLAGGMVVSRLKLSPRKCLRLMIVATGISALFVGGGYFLGCEQPVISMGASSGMSGSGIAGNASCHGRCHCDDTHFFPTCGADGITYFSPCHAGCSETDGMSYGSCSCINATMEVTSWSRKSRDDDEAIVMAAAVPGFCEQECGNLYPYAFLNFFGGISACLIVMPSFIVNVRSVSESDKPLAIGLSAFMGTLLGWFLGPIVYGRIIDTCCLLWSSGCDGNGSCSLYDSELFRNRFHIAFFSTRCACFVFFCLALLIANVTGVQFSPHEDAVTSDGDRPAGGEKLMLKRDCNANGGEKAQMKEEDDFLVGGDKRIWNGRSKELTTS